LRFRAKCLIEWGNMSSHRFYAAAFVLAGLTLFFPACAPPKSTVPEGQAPLTESQVRQLIREEVAAALLDRAAVSAHNRALQQEIDKLVLERVKEELAKIDAKALGDNKVAKSIQESGPKPTDYTELKRVDVSGIPTMEGKLERLLREFEGLHSYSHENEVVKQMIEMGAEGKPVMMELLRKSWEHRSNSLQQYALRDALKPLITKDDKAFLLEDLNSKSPVLADVVISMHLEEAGPLALQKVEKYASDPEQSLSGEFLQVALEFEEEAITPLLQKRLESGARDTTWLATQLDERFPDFDMNEQLKTAAGKLATANERYYLADLMMKRGLVESLPITLEALATPPGDPDTGSMRARLLENLRRRTAQPMSDPELIQWLSANANTLRWNPQTKLFEQAPPQP
jgi:hypothetical protein